MYTVREVGFKMNLRLHEALLPHWPLDTHRFRNVKMNQELNMSVKASNCFQNATAEIHKFLLRSAVDVYPVLRFSWLFWERLLNLNLRYTRGLKHHFKSYEFLEDWSGISPVVCEWTNGVDQ